MEEFDNIPPLPIRTTQPVLFLFLALPLGICSGYCNITLPYLFSLKGISVEQIAGLFLIVGLPIILKFFWGPAVDSSLSFRKWYLISITFMCLSLSLASLIPINKTTFTAIGSLCLLCSITGCALSTAYDALAAYNIPVTDKGKVSGYMQSAFMGGMALSGGAGLWLTKHLSHRWLSGCGLALIALSCGAAIFFVNEPKTTIRAKSAGKTLKNIFADLWFMLKGGLGPMALLLCLLPLGTSSASSLFAPIAKEWKAGADLVALVTGVFGGLITMAGCLIGGWICDRIRRQNAYILFGLLLAFAAAAMAVCPRTPLMYACWTTMYNFTGGLCYTAFYAFALEAVGKGAAASKMEFFVSISNIPIVTLTWLEGIVHTRWHSSGMLLIEAGCGLLSVIVYTAAKAFFKTRKKTNLQLASR